MGNKKRDLLHTPEGLWDHYGRDYVEYHAVTEGILERMHRYGYEDIKTPTFEFFDVFSNEIGTTPSHELYKFFDKEGHTLVLRPDFTPSVARCVAKYYMDDTEPLRFCYEGSAFTNTSNLQGKLKETTQMGAELMNDESAQADGEMLALLVESLLSTGLSKFQISVGNVEYFKGMCDAAGIDEDTEDSLRAYISGKNYYAAQSLLEGLGIGRFYTEQFLRITDLAGNDTDLEQILQTAPNARAASAIRRLIDVYHVLQLYGYEQYVSFDLSLLSKYRYYTGVLFKGYTYGVGDAIATGGRYDALLSYFGKKDAAAIGWMISVDTLMEALRAQHIALAADEQAVQRIAYTDETYEDALRQAMEIRRDGGRAVLWKS